jgi:predicted ribosomally synthesized peptide with nif11-like leader
MEEGRIRHGFQRWHKIAATYQTDQRFHMITEVDRFHNAVRGSKELRQEVQTVSDLDGIVGLAQSKGYDFSSSELMTWGKNKLGGDSSDSVGDGDLSEAKLKSLAGGKDPVKYMEIKLKEVFITGI